MMMTTVPIPPLCRQRSSRRCISATTRGSRIYERGTTCVAATENRRCDSGLLCGASSTRRAFWRTLAGMRLSWRAWKPAQPRREEWAEVNLRRFFARFSSGYAGPVERCLAPESCAAVCWQMGLCEGQCDFWHCCDCVAGQRMRWREQGMVDLHSIGWSSG